MDAKLFREILREGTEIVASLVSGRLSYLAFLELYDNFYYRAGIDGFDCSDEQRTLILHFSAAVKLHQRVQEIVDKSYLGGDAAAYKAAGRINTEEARRQIVDEALMLNLEETLTTLAEAGPTMPDL